MRIGVVGAGAAGLTSAWLLDEQHDVTLFEQDDRLGGHADTVEIEAHGRRLAIDAGFQFFAAGDAYATFNRLLDALNVPRRSYAATLTVFGTQRRDAVVMPPFRRGWPVWSSLTPRALCDMIRFRRFLARVPAFLDLHDTTLTIDEYIDRERLPRAFVTDFLFPLLLAFWCVEPEEFRGFAAYNALYYLGANRPRGLRPPQQSEIVGGLKVYVDALASELTRTRVRLATGIVRITRDVGGYVLEDTEGGRHQFDRVILATNARQALALVEPITDLEPVAAQLRRFDYFDTTIAIHGDRRLMPPRESAWSVVNARWDGAHSQLSIWNPNLELPVLKSWVTFEERMPDPLYALATYQHGKITVDYFDAQARLKALNGDHGLWLAGLYMHDADSHESAVCSAVMIAERLAPASARLAKLRG